MAESPAHLFGQLIGQLLEATISPILADFAAKHELYLDQKGDRPARSGAKVSWTDIYGNKHDLDFVLEKGGSDYAIGLPVAFIESAWRRYTKHSRNKAQEIQGAIVPLVQRYRQYAPFTGVILAGEFTAASLTQLDSLGFATLYFPYETVIAAFETAGIDARFEEDTPDADVAAMVRQWRALTAKQQGAVAERLVEFNQESVDRFVSNLEQTVLRQVDLVLVIPLHGRAYELASPGAAIDYLRNYVDDGRPKPLVRYEIEIRYNNGNRVHGEFGDKQAAIEFLQGFVPPIQPANDVSLT